MVDWEKAYGDAAERYRVKDCDVWQVGPHLLACGDLERGDGTRFLDGWVLPSEAYGRPGMFYSDPPWDTGNAKSFRTKAGVQKEGVTIQGLFDYVLETVLRTSGDVYIEIGNKHLADLKAWMAGKGMPAYAEFKITYYRKHSCWLVHAVVPGSVVVGVDGDATGLNDEDTPTWACMRSLQPGGVVYDCCLGLGATAVSAQKTGRVCVATELNPRRLAVSIDRLVNMGGLKAEKVGELGTDG